MKFHLRTCIALLLFSCQSEVEEGTLGELVTVERGRLSDPAIPYQPLVYEVGSIGKSGIEVLGRIPRNTKVTLLGMNSGEVHHTKVVRNINVLYSDYHGYMPFSVLEKQPSWGNKAAAIILRTHETREYRKLELEEVTNKLVIAVADKKIRASPRLFEEAFVINTENEQKKKENLAIAAQKKLPRMQKVAGVDIFLITYREGDAFGKGLLYVNDRFYPLYGECPFDDLHFYQLGDTVYLNYHSGTCESGHILEFYYAILREGVVAEWGSDAFSM